MPTGGAHPPRHTNFTASANNNNNITRREENNNKSNSPQHPPHNNNGLDSDGFPLNDATNKDIIRWMCKQERDKAKKKRQQLQMQQPTKIQLCRYFLNNRVCSYGNNCKFSHDIPLCQFFMAGYCHNGYNCKYIHNDNARYAFLQPKKKEKKKSVDEIRAEVEAVRAEVAAELTVLLADQQSWLDDESTSDEDELFASDSDEDFYNFLRRSHTQEEIRHDAQLHWLLETKPSILRDESRTLNLNDADAIVLKSANCVCCNHQHIPGENPCHVIDRINSTDPEYSKDKCMTLCQSCNQLKGTQSLAEFLMYVQLTCKNIPSLIETFCQKYGITSEEDLRRLAADQEIYLCPKLFPRSKEMMKVRKGVSFQELFSSSPNTRAMAADVVTRECTNCKLPCCDGANREDNDASYASNVLLRTLWPMCWNCNTMMNNFPYHLYLAQLLAIQDHRGVVGVGNIFVKLQLLFLLQYW